MSTFTWLDYSESDRQQMLDVVRLFRESGTLDELGIGTVRDAIANRLFPGTSTIQTRARYFLFIPWIYRKLEKREVSSEKILLSARYEETQLIKALVRSHPHEAGVIGRDAGSSLQRLPSNIYWNGLFIWGIREFVGSQMQYHRSLDRFYAVNRRAKIDTQNGDEQEPLRHNWHTNLPEAPAGFPQESTLQLSFEEANYLRERIVTSLPRTLLAFLVEYGRSTERVDFPWQHPQYDEFPAVQRDELVHARNFSEVIHGAQLLYNYMLAELWAEQGGSLEHQERYAAELSKWAGLLALRHDELAQWDKDIRFWDLVTETNPHVPYRTKEFIKAWFHLTLNESGGASIADNQMARQLIHNREIHLKGRLARLENRRALELWSGESGAAQLNYRWNISQTLVDDILQGLNQNQIKAENKHA